uniref:Uncharacterized protein n=1 Tax=viral metagenome TaxID=1070528 RepID=A0A6C0CT53_9ZZZZ
MIISNRVDSAIYAGLSMLMLMIWHMLRSDSEDDVPFHMYVVIIGALNVVAFLNYFDGHPDYK